MSKITKKAKPVFCYNIKDEKYLPYDMNQPPFKGVHPFNSIAGCLSYLTKAGYYNCKEITPYVKRIFCDKYVKGNKKIQNKLILDFTVDGLHEKIKKHKEKKQEIEEKRIMNGGGGTPTYLYDIKSDRLKNYPSRKAAENYIKIKYYDGVWRQEDGWLFNRIISESKNHKEPRMYDNNVIVSDVPFRVKELDYDDLKRWLIGIQDSIIEQYYYTFQKHRGKSKYIQKGHWFHRDWSRNSIYELTTEDGYESVMKFNGH